MTREELIEAHKLEVAEQAQVKPESVYVFDAETAPKIEHNWMRYGTRFVCANTGHPRHEAYGRPM